jgi:hypothetical protein
MAMVAPRALLVTGNPDYEWLADESGHVGSIAAKEIWNALGVPDRFGFSIVDDHPHCVIPDNQIPEIEAFVEKFLLGNEDVNTNVSTTPYNTNLSPWINWDTPELTEGESYFGKSSLVYPPHLEINLDTTIVFVWKKVDGAEKYYIQISKNPDFTNIFKADSTISDTLITITDLLKGVKYYWRIQVKGTGGLGPWSEFRNFTTAISLPGVTELVSATPLPRRADYISLTWKKVEYASKYSVELSVYQDFSDIFKSVTTSDTTFNINGTKEGQKYYWRVQAKNVSGAGPWSDISEFTIIVAPTDLELERTGLNEITLTWRDRSDVEKGYVIERKHSPDITFLVIDTLQGSAEEYVDGGVEQGLTFTYRIKAIMDSAESQYSNEASLLLVGVNEDNDLPDEFSMSQNFPNPFSAKGGSASGGNPRTTIEYKIPSFVESTGINQINSSTGNQLLVTLKIYDTLGREVATLVDEQQPQGHYKVEWDASGYPSGVYLYRLNAGEYSQSKKLVFLK